MESPHGVRPQRIGPLQVTIVAAMRRRELARAELLPKLEQAVNL